VFRFHAPAILIILGFTLIRLLVAPTFGLGVDEAHYLLYAKYLDLSYVDHPPLVGWIHAAGYYLLGTDEFLARLPAILLFAFTSWFAYRLSWSLSRSREKAIVALLALNGAFMLNALAIMLLPDSILMLLSLLIVIRTRKLVRHGRTRDFLLIGLLFGLAGLTKYTAVLFVPAVLIHLAFEKRFDLLFSPRMILTGLIALCLVSPVLIWNIQHDFISFRYQGGHVFAAQRPDLSLALKSLAAQFGAYSPFLFLIAFYGFAAGGRIPLGTARLMRLTAALLLAFFVVGSFYETTLPHWPCIFYLFCIPMGAMLLWERPGRFSRNFVLFSLGFSLFLTAFAYAELSNRFIRYPDYQSPFRDIYGYDQIAARAHTILRSGPKIRPRALAVSNWTMGSRVEYYSLPYDQEVYVIDDRHDQFDVWKPNPPLGYDLLFLNSRFHGIDVDTALRCDRVCPADELPLFLNGRLVDRVTFVWCLNYQGRR